VLSEAREAGCAIVASNVGGIPEALDSGAAGILVPPADPAALSEALGLLLRDPAVREAYRARAREGLAAFSAQRYSDDIERIYATLLAK
jgi:glycosyltransferase involved in cell wall biosynthesis